MASDNQIIAEVVVEGVEQFKAKIVEALGYTGDFNELLEKVKNQPVIPPDAPQKIGNFKQQLKTATTELVAMNLQLAEMKDAGKAGTKEFTDLEKKMSDLQKKAGNLKDAMADAAEQIKAAGSDTSGLDKAIRAVGTATAAFQVFEGATILAGKGNEDLQKALVKLNAVMAITQGLQQIQNELVRQDSVFKKMASAATAAYNVVVGQSTGALKLFRIALAATGIGLAIVGIAALVENWDKLKSAIFGATYNLDEFNKRLQESDEFIEGRTRSQEREILEMQKAGKTEAEIAQKRLEFAKENEQLAYERLQQLRDEEVASRSNQEANKKILEDIEKQKEIYFNSQLNVTKAEMALDKELANEKKIQADKISKILEQQIQDRNKQAEYNKKLHQRELEQDQERLKLAQEAEKRRKQLITVDATGDNQREKRIEQENRLNTALRKRKEAEFVPASREDQLAEMFEKAQSYSQEIQKVISQTTDLIANATQIRAENEIAALENKRKRGLISEKQYEREVAKIKNEAARKNRIAQTIEAVALIPQAVAAGFFAGLNIPGGSLITAGIFAGVAGAFATAQAALVAAQPIPKFRDGGSVAKRLGLIRGKSHEQGGVPIEVEGDEFVMSKKAVKHYGVDFMDRVNKMKLNPVVTMQAKMDHIKNTDYKLYEHLATLGGYMKQDYRANENGNNILLGIKEALKRNNTYV